MSTEKLYAVEVRCMARKTVFVAAADQDEAIRVAERCFECDGEAGLDDVMEIESGEDVWTQDRLRLVMRERGPLPATQTVREFAIERGWIDS